MKRILVIEDETPVLANILEMLRFEQFEVVGADNGFLGIQLARELLPDLIICDIMMPGMDGYEVLQELRRDLDTVTIPFIFLTARGAREDMRKGMDLGADDYITKPYVASELLVAVKTRLERREVVERQRLRVLSHRLFEIQEAERRDVVQRLQSDVVELLTGLKVILEMSKRLSENSLRNRLDDVKALAEEMIYRVNELSSELRPASLDDLGLLPALWQYFKRYTEQTQIQVIFKHAGLEQRFLPEIETAAFRIVQEALDNVARHAHIQQVDVQLWVDIDALSIQVEDQGQGFHVESAINSATSTGLNGMHERAILLGGQFTVTSELQAGTQVIARLPLEKRVGPSIPDRHSSALPRHAVSQATLPDVSPPEKYSAQHGAAAIQIVLADSHDLIRGGLRSLLETEAQFLVVGDAATAQEALDLTKRFYPQVLIIDLNMGWNIVAQVADCCPTTHILMLSMHTDEAYIQEGFRQGATGYALKESSGDDMIHAVREVAAGRRYLSRSLSERAINHYLNAPEDTQLGEHGVLTSREIEILKLIVQGSKNAEIASQFSISRRTVETHRANLMRKLGLRTQADLVRYALQRGIVDLKP
ncbi:MAG: response regulator [Chloroflexi bacterium]|nr:response regulator [Chloroflexota bacterium]